MRLWLWLFLVSTALAQTGQTGAMLGLDQTFTGKNTFNLGITVGPIAFSSLSSLSGATTTIFVSDGKLGSNPCVGGGTGALAIRINGAWNCNAGSLGASSTPYFDCRNFGGGCIGDGVHDDLAAINATLLACSGTGGKVIIPPSTTSYITSNSIAAVSNCTLDGQGGATITIPSSGWALVPGSAFGVINIYQVNHFRVTGMHIVGNKTAVDSNHSPKLIYLDPGAAGGAQDIQIDHNWFDTSAFEGIWVGCTSCGGVTSPTRVDVSDNVFTGVGYGGADSTQGLPAIQCNWQDGVIANNRLYDSGTAIGCSQGNSTIIGNTVDGFQNKGISVGDGGNYGPYPISGNTVKFTVTTTMGTAQEGYFIDNGVSGTNPLESVTNNQCLLIGTVGQTPGICYFNANSPDTVFSGNSAEIRNHGSGFHINGSVAGNKVELTSNTCKFVNETTTESCFVGIPNGIGNTLTVHSKNNHAYGLTRANSSYGIDFNNSGGGTINAYVFGDTTDGGFVRVGNVYNSSGNIDNLPIITYFTGGVGSLGNSLAPYLSLPWSSLAVPTANLSLAMGSFSTAMTFGDPGGPHTSWTQTLPALSGSPISTQMIIQDTTGNTNTGSVLTVSTVAGSTARPFAVTAQGTANGVTLDTAGIFKAQGTGDIRATSIANNATALGIILGTPSFAGSPAFQVATGTAPFSIISTTPVANLSLGGGSGTSVTSAIIQAVGSGAGLTGWTQGADNSTNCPANSRCIEAPTSITTSWTDVIPTAGPSAQSVEVYSGISSAKSTQTFMQFQHNRITTGAIGGTTRTEVLLTWTTTFTNTSYTPTCTVEDSSTAATTQGLTFERIKTKSATQVGAIINNPTGGAITGTLDCVGYHD